MYLCMKRLPLWPCLLRRLGQWERGQTGTLIFPICELELPTSHTLSTYYREREIASLPFLESLKAHWANLPETQFSTREINVPFKIIHADKDSWLERSAFEPMHLFYMALIACSSAGQETRTFLSRLHILLIWKVIVSANETRLVCWGKKDVGIQSFLLGQNIIYCLSGGAVSAPSPWSNTLWFGCAALPSLCLNFVGGLFAMAIKLESICTHENNNCNKNSLPVCLLQPHY